MSDIEQSISWYEPGNIRATVENGLANDVAPTLIAEYLAERELDDVRPSRVERIVDTMPTSENASETDIDLSQPTATEAEPRDSPTNQLAVYDLEYVSNREAARLIGLALEQFDGNTVRPPGATQVETDLVWHRQHMTVGLRIVPTPSGTVDTNHVDALLDGTVVPDDVRSLSELAIVTNRAFTDEALASAEEHDIKCLDAGHVEELLRRARIPMAAVGTLLEDGESHDGPLTDLVDIPPIPEPRKTVDPLEINRAFDTTSLKRTAEADDTTSPVERTDTTNSQQRTGLDSTTARDDPLGGDQPAAGETGSLYADPGEDGDFEAFDRFIEDIDSEDQRQEQSADGDTNSADEMPSKGDDELMTFDDVDKNELLLDLLDAKQDAGERMSWKDVRRHGSYPVEYYQKEFGSLADALSGVNAEYTGKSQ